MRIYIYAHVILYNLICVFFWILKIVLYKIKCGTKNIFKIISWHEIFFHVVNCYRVNFICIFVNMIINDL